MSDRNEVFLEGALTKPPETRFTTNGNAATSLNLVTVENFNGKDFKAYHDVVVWGTEIAETLANLISGSRVAIKGRLSKRSWEKDGKKVWKTEVVANQGQVTVIEKIGEDDVPF